MVPEVGQALKVIVGVRASWHHRGQMRRMILLAHGRSGSELLAEALRRHPLIEVHGELFIDKERVRREEVPVGGRWWRADEDGASFLREVVFVDRGHPVVGFKLMVTHVRSGPGRTAWTYLAGEEVDVVHLIRENLLEALVSRHVADHLQRWHIRTGTAVPEVQPFNLDPRAAAGYFTRIASLNRAALERFTGHRRISLEYQRDLVADFHGTVRRVFEFLGVPPIAVEPAFLKQARRPPAAQVTNWEELVAFFAGSEWSPWFT
jgi:LPS sulfotransferase NodH